VFEARQLQHIADMQLNIGLSANYAGRGRRGNHGRGRGGRGHSRGRGGAPCSSDRSNKLLLCPSPSAKFAARPATQQLGAGTGMMNPTMKILLRLLLPPLHIRLTETGTMIPGRRITSPVILTV
jgi:hypothetical protein